MWYSDEIPAMAVSKELEEKVEKLKKCKSLPEEELNGKYKKAYTRLRDEIKALANEHLLELVEKRIFLRSTKQEYIDALQEIASKYAKLLGKTLFKEMNTVKFKAYLEELYDELLYYGYSHEGCVISESTLSRINEAMEEMDEAV